MGASASTRKAGGLLTAEQKAEIVQQVGVVPTSEWAADASELTDLEAARAEVLRLRRIIHDAVRDAASRAPSGSPREDEDALDGASSPGARRKKRDGAVRQAVREVGHRADDVYVPVRFEKSAAVEAMLRTMFRTNRLFEKCVSPSAADEAAALIAAFEPRSVRPGETIIRQGSQGEHFYVIEAGAVEISVTTQGNELVVGALEAGASFGELALVYGTPRTATVNAVGACELWQISRRVYRQIELHFKVDRLARRVKRVAEVTISDGTKAAKLSSVLARSELEHLADALDEETFDQGAMITRQGEEGDYFYIIEEGEVEVHIDRAAPPYERRDLRSAEQLHERRDTIRGTTRVKTLAAGDIFGEKALLKDDVRTASIVAHSERVLVLTLARDDFTALLGSVAELLSPEVERVGPLVQGVRESPRLAAAPGSVPRGSADSDCHARVCPEDPIQLGQLEVLRTLGRGAFGRVRLARQTTTGVVFALKCQSKAAIVAHRLQNEILMERSILAMLDHPFILKLFASLQDDACIYFVLELAQGGEVFTWLKQKGRFDEPAARFFAAQVVLGVWHIHSKRIAYRDLKPENLVLDRHGYLKIVDFGLAKVVDGKTWTLCGTPDYLAPEIIRNEGHDKAVDYWALGVLVYELVAGLPPFYADDPIDVYENVLNLKYELREDAFSRNLADLLRRLLQLAQPKRLGNGRGGARAISKHRWFAGFDWDGLLSYRLEPPFAVELDASDDLRHFDVYDEDEARPEPCPEWNPEL